SPPFDAAPFWSPLLSSLLRLSAGLLAVLSPGSFFGSGLPPPSDGEPFDPLAPSDGGPLEPLPSEPSDFIGSFLSPFSRSETFGSLVSSLFSPWGSSPSFGWPLAPPFGSLFLGEPPGFGAPILLARSSTLPASFAWSFASCFGSPRPESTRDWLMLVWRMMAFNSAS